MADTPLAAKPASESASKMVQLVLPNDTNPMGNVLGGTVMHWIDLVAAITAHRHARRLAVTASIDDLSFEAPIRMGQLAILAARVTHTSRSAMEIQVDVDAEDLNSGRRVHTSTAHLTFVALDESGRPTPVPPLRVEPGEQADYEQAVIRRRERLARLARRPRPASHPAPSGEPTP